MNKLMKCGHSANGFLVTNERNIPCCIICDCVAEENKVLDLTNRTAKCTYYGKSKPNRRYANDECNYGCEGKTTCMCNNIKSSLDLPFFEHKPTELQDEFYCGCFGWD